MAEMIVGVSYTSILSRGDEDLIARLKQQLLLLDRIVMRAELPMVQHPDILWLANRGLVELRRVDVQAMVRRALAADLEVPGFVNVDLASAEGDLSRLWAVQESQPGSVLVPIQWFDQSSTLIERAPCSTTNATVAEVVIRNLPVPDTLTPFERILDFRADSEVQDHLIRLRFWMRKVARAAPPWRELEEELEELLFAYEEAMKLHRMRYEHGLCRVLLTTAAGFVENLLRIKPRAVIETLFECQERKLRLLEAEAAAPGRELAYIAAARRAFPSG